MSPPPCIRPIAIAVIRRGAQLLASGVADAEFTFTDGADEACQARRIDVASFRAGQQQPLPPELIDKL